MSDIVAAAVRVVPENLWGLPILLIPEVRATNAIRRHTSFRVVGDLANISDDELLTIGGLGPGSLHKLAAAISQLPAMLANGVLVLGDIEDLGLRRTEARFENPAVIPTPDRSGLPVVSSLRSAIEATIHSFRTGGYRQYLMFSMRLGIDQPRQHTLDEVGETFKVTRERVRQVVARMFREMRKQPVGIAVRTIIDDLLEEYVCVMPEDLFELSPWLTVGIRPRTVIQLVYEFHPERIYNYGDWILSRLPREHVESILQDWYDRVDRLPRSHTSQEKLGQLAAQVACDLGFPMLTTMLNRLALRRLAARKLTFTQFAREFIEDRNEPAHVSELTRAAIAWGFVASEGQARNMLAATPGVYPLGHSIYGTLDQAFPGLSEIHREIAGALGVLVVKDRKRQWHADELLEIVARDFGEAGLQAVGGAHYLAVLLRAETDLAYLGRLVFGTPEASVDRLDVLNLARDVLEREGRPLPMSTLLEKMKQRRGLSNVSPVNLSNQLIEVSPGMWGLPERDIPLSERGLELLVEDAWAAVGPGEAISVQDLRSRLIAGGSPEARGVSATLLGDILCNTGRFAGVGRGHVRLAERRAMVTTAGEV